MAQVKNPRDYLDTAKRRALEKKPVPEKDRAFEFMLNALRLTDGISLALFEQRTGLSIQTIAPYLQIAKEKKLLDCFVARLHPAKNTELAMTDPHNDETIHRIKPTSKGQQYLNDLMAIFL